MPYIPKHHTKQKREGDGGEDSWVYLFIAADTVCIYYLLMGFGESVGGREEGRGG
jgi:hypothetical protein